MPEISKESLCDNTRCLLEVIEDHPALSSFTLIGGTALALQLNHRLSEDLDFWCNDSSLDKRSLDGLIRSLRNDGHSVALSIPHNKITQARINGVDLLAKAQDWTIDGVKVTFFARNDGPYNSFSRFNSFKLENQSFAIMGLDGLFAMKSYVISQRVKSRDLFDLKYLLETGRFQYERIFVESFNADHSVTEEQIKSVLCGNIPLDTDDPGFETIGLDEKVDDIYAFFTDINRDHEVNLACDILATTSKIHKLEQ